METKRRYEHAEPAGDTLPAAVSPERVLRVVARAGRNPGTPLDLDLMRALRVNRSAVARRAATIPTRRTGKKDWPAAWLPRPATCIAWPTRQGAHSTRNGLRPAA